MQTEKSKEEIRNDIAKRNGYNNWNHLSRANSESQDYHILNNYIDEAMKEYHAQCSGQSAEREKEIKETLKQFGKDYRASHPTTFDESIIDFAFKKLSIQFSSVSQEGKRERVRESVKWFSIQMEKTLRDNDHKGGWKNCDFGYLFLRLKKELSELLAADIENEPVENKIKECTDIANFAMMIADNLRDKLKP